MPISKQTKQSFAVTYQETSDGTFMNNFELYYSCDGRNTCDQYLDANRVRAFCNARNKGNIKEYGFGDGVTSR